MSRRVDRDAADLGVMFGLWLAATLAAAVLAFAGSAAFAPYFGPMNPIVGTGAVIGLGMASLGSLQRRGSFTTRGDLGSFAIPVLVAIPLAVPVVLLDLLGGFPVDINAPAPESLLFYPTIALVAESVFHLVPLAGLLGLSHAVLRHVDWSRLVRPSLVVVSLIEPTLQVMWTPPESPWWTTAYVGLHVFAINLVGLHFFLRSGFLTGYAFRLSYYATWHVAWGHARLGLLFG